MVLSKDSMIQTVKITMRKAKTSGHNINMSVLCLRTTAIDHNTSFSILQTYCVETINDINFILTKAELVSK